MPPPGPTGVDSRLLREAWDDVQEAVEAMDDIGWSSNAEFIVDIWAATASMLCKQEDILPLIVAAARKRPEIEGLQRAAEAICAQSGDFAAALEVNRRLPDCEITILRRVAFLHEAGQHRACVELLESRLPELNPAHPFFGNAVVMATLSANVVARSDLVKSWSSLIDNAPGLSAFGAVLRYFLGRAVNKLGGDALLLDLEQEDAKLGHPIPTTLALFDALDPADKVQAEKIVGVSERIRSRVRLSHDVAARLGIALITLQRWSDILDLCAEAAREFDITSRLVAFKGLALDRLGRTDEARQVLESMLEGGISDSVALNTYVNIMVRWGYVEKAIATTERILESAKTRVQKIECIRLLFNLVQTADPKSTRLIDLTFRMGELADQTEEVEEGVFLSMALVGTLTCSGTMTQKQRADLQIRADQFFTRFPDSKVLRRIDTAPDASGEVLLETLKRVSGHTEEREKLLVKIETQLQRGEIPIPYAWRPKDALANVHDLLHLWELTKYSGADDKNYHFSIIGPGWAPLSPRVVRESLPLLDLTTLLVLLDLDLFEPLFTFFPRIAVGQETLAELMRLSHIFSGSPWREKSLGLQRHLRDRISQVIQPHVVIEQEGSHRLRSSEELRRLSADPQFLLYADDYLFRFWCGGEGGPPRGMCTLDLLTALEDAGVLSSVEVARKMALLCTWHVGIQIALRYQLAIIPDALWQVKSVDKGVDLLQLTPDFMAMATGMWDFRGDLMKSLSHVASVIRQLLDQTQISPVAIAAVVGIWYIKTKLRGDSTHPPLNLLSNLTLLTIAQNPAPDETGVRRLWDVYLGLVEFEHKDHMDEEKERDARRALAADAAKSDAELAKKGVRIDESLRERLMRGLTPSTEAADVFSDAYSVTRIAIDVKVIEQR